MFFPIIPIIMIIYYLQKKLEAWESFCPIALKLKRLFTALQTSDWNQYTLCKGIKTWKNAIVEYLDYQIPVTQLKGPRGNGDMQAAKQIEMRPPTGGRQI